MTQRLFVALLTVAVFVAGYVARLMTEPRQTIPPAPAALTNELASNKPAATDSKDAQQLDRAKLIAEIRKLRPHIEAYTTQVAEINAEHERELTQLLTPAQQAAMLDWLHWGGQLVLIGGAGPSYSILRESFLEPYLPADGTGESRLLGEADLKPLSDSYPPPFRPPTSSDSDSFRPPGTLTALAHCCRGSRAPRSPPSLATWTGCW